MGRVAGRDCLNRQFHLREWRYDRTDLDRHRREAEHKRGTNVREGRRDDGDVG